MTEPNVAGAPTRGLARTSRPPVQSSRTGVAARASRHDIARPVRRRSNRVTNPANQISEASSRHPNSMANETGANETGADEMGAPAPAGIASEVSMRNVRFGAGGSRATEIAPSG